MPNEPATHESKAGLAAVARGIRHRYDAGEAVLRGIDLEVERGVVTALIGANGSGKTTLLRILAGILEPTAGSLAWPGPARATDPRRQRGYVAQDPALDPEMTCGEILTLFAALHGVGRGERPGRLAAVAESFGLTKSLSRRVDQLSGGQKRRLHLAAGMLHDPTLLCLDEPGAGLDPDGASNLWVELGRRAQEGAAVVIVTHDLAAVERCADTVLILEQGALVGAGAPRDLVAEHPPDLAAVYSRLTGREASALRPQHRASGRRGR